ncbi:hypothetical protein ACETAC_01425 [Aceticella autotrophica]|uniref:Uncharacterized protein n=1 Tax=Aceticella autotrophica TaxID=2755338 RepID=A0A975AW71_9THEO|nr:hypothetical protein [Aceticella autotrophica]QSZ27604.1 hypothetical protein ACETAC_01425 [Aceticella autotrophica]
MKKVCLILLLFFCLNTVTVVSADSTQKQWTTLATSVNQDGTTVNTNVFGYYENVDNFGQVFIECDPNTGQETGNAYIPNVKIGTKTIQKQIGFDKKQEVDLTTVKEVKPAQVQIIYPNVPTSINWDNELGAYVIGSTLTLPYSPVLKYILQGNLPDYDLCIVQISNPNNFPIKANFVYHENSYSVSLGANETKYVKVDSYTNDFFFGYSCSTQLDSNNLPADYPSDYLNNLIFKAVPADGILNPSPDEYGPSLPFGICFKIHGYANAGQFNYQIDMKIVYDFNAKKFVKYSSIVSEYDYYLRKDVLLPENNASIAFENSVIDHFNNVWGFYPPIFDSNTDMYQVIYLPSFTSDYTNSWTGMIRSICYCQYPGSTVYSSSPYTARSTAWVPSPATLFYATDDPSNIYGDIGYNGDLKHKLDTCKMHLDQYRFIPTDGNVGYLQKYSVDGIFTLYEEQEWNCNLPGGSPNNQGYYCTYFIYKQE